MYLLETLYHSLDDDEVSASAKNTRAPLGVEVLYGAFKKWGYQKLPDATRRYQTFKKTFVGTIFGGLVYLILTKER